MKKHLIDFTDVQIDGLEKEINSSDKDDIAIIGLSLELPDAKNIGEFASILANCTDCIHQFPIKRKKDVQNFLEQVAQSEQEYQFFEGAYLEQIDGFDYSFFGISPNEANFMSPEQRIFLQNAWQCLDDGGYANDNISGSETGVFVGYSSDELYDYKDFVYCADSEKMEEAFSGNIASVIASRISYCLNLKGPSMLIDTACSSSLVAVHQACNAIKNEDCDMALAGGIRVRLVPVKNRQLFAIESEDGKTRSFDESSTGTGWGEGVGVILLKKLSKAIRDKDHIYNVIKGSAINQDGSSTGLTAPDLDAQCNAIVKAWKNATINPEKITYIETHGTGTQIGDPVEVEGIKKAYEKFTSKKQFCALSSLKSNIGHLDSASGIIGLIKCIVSLNNNRIYPIVHFERPNNKIDFENSPVYLSDHTSEWEVQTKECLCGINSFGISGTNCHMVLQQYPKQLREYENKKRLFVASAHAMNSLVKNMKDYYCHLKENSDINLDDLTYTLLCCKKHFNCRIAFAYNNFQDLLDKIKLFTECGSNYEANGIYVGEFSIVMPEKEQRREREITYNEKMHLDYEINQYLERIIEQTEKLEHHYEYICKSFISGADIQWRGLVEKQVYYKVNLPKYNFDEKRCWVNLDVEKNNIYDVVLKKIPIGDETTLMTNKSILIIKSLKDTEFSLPVDISENNKIYYLIISSSYGKINDHCMHISDIENDYQKAMKELKLNEVDIIWDMAAGTTDENRLDDKITEIAMTYSWNLIQRLKVVSKIFDRIGEYCVITKGFNKSEENPISLENSGLFAVLKCAVWEFPEIIFKMFDVETFDSATIQRISYRMSERKAMYMAFLGENIYQPYLKKIHLVEENKKYDGHKMYIITGGLGALGQRIADHFLETSDVVLLGKQLESDFTIEKKCAYELLKEKASKNENKIQYYSCDINKYHNLNLIFEKVVHEMGNCDGVFHCAGNGNGRLISQEEMESFEEVVKTKVYGLNNIDLLTEKYEIARVYLFSSAITLVGGIGSSAYTIANSYMNSFAAYKNCFKQKYVSINWPAWKECGMSTGIIGLDKKQLFHAIDEKKGIALLDKLLVCKKSSIYVGNVNKDWDIKDNLDCMFIQSDEFKPIQKSVKHHKDVAVNYVVVTLKGANFFTEIEQEIGNIWGKILGFSEIDVYDSFFSIGGDSLTGIRVINRINDKFHCKMDVVDFFKHTTIRKLSECINMKYINTPLEQFDMMEVELKDSYHLSFAQSRLFVLEQLKTKRDTSYNIPAAFLIRGTLDKNKFVQCFQSIFKRHEAFRTSFSFQDGNPVQIVEDITTLDIVQEKLLEQDMEEKITQFVKPFDLGKAPLFRIELYEMNEDKHLFLFDSHHIVVDGLAIGIIINEFVKLYDDQKLSPIRLQYKDYAEWQWNRFQQDYFVKQENYWLSRISTEENIAEIKTDYPRKSSRYYTGEKIRYTLDGDYFKKLNQSVRKLNTTMFSFLLSVYDVFLYKYTGNSYIQVGTAISGRSFQKVEGIVGMFANTLVMANKVDNDKKFFNFVKEVEENVYRAYENQDYPFELLVDKLKKKYDPTRNPLFDTMFTMQNREEQTVRCEDLEFVVRDIPNHISKFDLTLQSFECDDRIEIDFEYSMALYRRETIERIIHFFDNILKAVITKNDCCINDIDMLSENEKHELLHCFNDTAVNYDRNLTIYRMFEQQVANIPDSIALKAGNDSITYRELNTAANKMARILLNNGIKYKDIVGIYVKRGINMVVAMLSILKVGAVYLPIDPSYPYDRIKYMLDDSKTRFLIVSDETQGIECDAKQVNIASYQKEEDGSNLEMEGGASDLAYIIYTSGSTGCPKGVMLEQRSVVNFIYGVMNVIPFQRYDTILALTTISFDIFVLESLLPLAKGMRIVIANEEEQINSQKLVQLLEKNRVDVIQITPSRLKLMMESEAFCNELRKVKTVLVGGEAFPKPLLEKLQNLGVEKIYNMYGPTETTVWSTISNLSRQNEINVGKPIQNTQLYILDHEDQLLPKGVIGQLCIGGEGLARGYLNSPELTNDKFINAKFDPKLRIYKTGDLAQWLPNGDVIILGRSDTQVKVRGYRIELGEIENVLLQLKGIKTCVVCVKEVEEDNKIICAFYVADNGVDATPIRRYLLKNLPEYMIPQQFIRLDKIPLMANGKTDKIALLSMDFQEYKQDGKVEAYVPKTGMERKILNIWKKVLNNNMIGSDDSFFELGGNSLLLVKMHQLLCGELKVSLNIGDLFSYPTISLLANYLSKEDFDGSDGILFPKEYIISDNNMVLEKNISYRMNPLVVSKLKELSIRKRKNLNVITFSGFVYLIYKITKQGDMAFALQKRSFEPIVNIEMKSINQIEHFDNLFDIISDTYEEADNHIRQNRKVEKEKLDGDKLVILYSEKHSSEKLGQYDIILEIVDESNTLLINVRYNSNRVSAERMEEMVKYIVNTFQLIIKKNESEEE